MRWCVALVLAAFISVPLAGNSSREQRPGDGPVLELMSEGKNGTAIPVDGIVCDNLRAMPPEQRNRLEVRLPASVTGRDLTGSVCNPDETTADSDGRNNAGTVVTERGRLFYYPPYEYNRRQEPRGLRDVDGPATRFVLLKIQARFQDGSLTTFPPRKIVLARPPSVLIHGINRGPDCWIPMVRALGNLKGREGRRLEIPSSVLDHFAPANYEGVSFQDRQRFPGFLYYGSGPVEIGAVLLARHINEIRRRVLAGEPLPANEYGRADAMPTSYTYRMPGERQGPPVRLAIHRVDIIAWSYGGVIARWYLASGGQRPTQRVPGARTQRLVYQGGYVLPGPEGRPLDLTPRVDYHYDVRKLITLGSMWRGVPMVNCLNEIRFSNPREATALSNAPVHIPQWMPRALWNQIGADRNVGSLAHALDMRVRINTPAMEVMAIDSSWLSLLIYGTTDPGGQAPAQPFRSDIAYGSVAGDNSSYLALGPIAGISPYGALMYFQKPPWFPYLALEQRAGLSGAYSPIVGNTRDYTDGIVPVWSAVIPGGVPGASCIVPASHETFFTDPETLEYTVRWLNHAALPMGNVLNPVWNTPVASRDGRKRWEFREGEMGPTGRNTLYGRIDGIGRVLLSARFPERSLILQRVTKSSVRLEWKAPVGGRLHRVTLYEDTGVFAARARPKLRKLRVIEAETDAVEPYAIVEGLNPGKNYYIAAEARAANSPDPPIIVKSGPIKMAVGE